VSLRKTDKLFHNDQECFVQGFKKFVLRGNVLDLAVAVIIGAAFEALIAALVKDLITPLIAALGGQPDFSDLFFTVNKSKFTYGDFINALLAFLIMAAIVYFVIVAPVGKLITLTQRKQEASERDCPECLSEIPVKATRCKYCTAVIVPPAATPAPVA
jgi:large conductance mechanosensitive channel